MRILLACLCATLLLAPSSIQADDAAPEDPPVPGPRDDRPPEGEAPPEGRQPPSGRQPPPGRRPGGRRAGMLERLWEMDADGDGTISRDEFRGPDRVFDRLDADGDDVITRTEVEAMAARRGGRNGNRGEGRRGGARLDLANVDTNGDGRISKAEWDAFFEAADKNGDGVTDADEWAAAVGGRALRDPAPPVGAKIPAVSAARLKGDGSVDLAAPTRLTVYIFGSWT